MFDLDNGWNEAGRARLLANAREVEKERDAKELQRLAAMRVVDVTDQVSYLDNLAELAAGKVRVAGGVRQLRDADQRRAPPPGMVEVPGMPGCFTRIE